MTDFNAPVKLANYRSTDLPQYIWDALLEPLSIAFQRPATDAETAAKFLILFGNYLRPFPEEVLVAAADYMIRTRKDPWFPTISECLKVCETLHKSGLDVDTMIRYAAIAKRRVPIS